MTGERSYSIYRKTVNGEPVGNWLARAYVGNGDERYESLRTKDRGLAEARAALWFHGLLTGERLRGGPASLSDLWAAYQETDAFRNLAGGTAYQYRRAWGFLLEGGDPLLGDLAPAHMMAFRDAMLERFAPQTVRNMMGAAIATVFNYAVDAGWLDRSPMRTVRYPQATILRADARPVFTDEQMDRLMGRADPTHRRLWAIYRWTGCRRMEGLRMERGDIHRGEGWVHIRGTKNARANRVMPLMPELLPHLKPLPKRGPLYPFSYEKARHVLEDVSRSLRIRPANPTMFRRAFITRMRRQSRIPESVWLRWVGHSSTAMARDHYEAQDLDYERGLVSGR